MTMAALDSAARMLYRGARRSLVWIPLNLLCAFRGRNIERCILTVGYSRSGSTLVGRLLNAHPEIVFSHELDLSTVSRSPRLAARLGGRGRLVRLILENDRNVRRWTSYRGSGYSYAVKTGWQGKYSRLRVVGDKDSHVAAERLHRRPESLESLRRRIGAPIRAVFTFRNPYDVAAAEYLGEMKKKGEVAFVRRRDYAPAEAGRLWIGEESVSRLREHSDKLARVIAMFPKEDALPVYHEDFVASPREKLREICAFCGVECADDYLDACASIVFPAPHPTRSKVRWSPDRIAEIGRTVEKHSAFLGRYAGAAAAPPAARRADDPGSGGRAPDEVETAGRRA